ncbi:hypothetical protein MNBD_CHLOROFLEXI01-4821 [hydrothermal vent metagenome]|uniref:DUF4345 domain-containing protein n=1 Tax=hydrothermal vent metagenome TaxID=652676 RepID=A0A3B0V318_9ZZZZ
MIYSDLARQALLAVTGGIFLTFAFWAILKPESLAAILGYELKTKNAFSEFHAIYVGVFIGQSLLCALAFVRVQDASLGDLVALFLLGQPLGRLIAAMRRGFPSGFLFLLFIMELIAGIVLLAVRPTV